MGSSPAPVPDDVLRERYVNIKRTSAYVDDLVGAGEAADLAREVLALRDAARVLLRIADDGSGVASWSNAWDALRALLPEHKERPK